MGVSHRLGLSYGRAEDWRACASMPLPVLLLLAIGTGSVAAHENRPVYIELTETAPQYYRLQWKVPLSIASFGAPDVTLSEQCAAQSQPAQLSAPTGLVRRVDYYCPDGLTGEAITLDYPGANPSVSSVVRYRSASGERHVMVLDPHETSWVVPEHETPFRVAYQYLLLGVEHIWAGVDHLLFVACLMWIAASGRRLLITITGFTIAHSITLILSALQLVRLPVPPVEAAIALSVMFVAAEIMRGPRDNLTWRRPIVVATCFGLLHGLGFAAALSDIGLPQTELVTGLLFFNVGVEIGQVLFAAGLIGLVRTAQLVAARWLAQLHLASLRNATACAIGALAAFLFIQRGLAF